MSFSFEYHAKTPYAAAANLEKHHAPECVKTAIIQALQGIAPGKPVRVAANGHLPYLPVSELHSSNYSSVKIEVTPLEFVE